MPAPTHEPGVLPVAETDSKMPGSLTRALDHLQKFVDAVQKCPDHRSVASLDAADGITCGDMRAILRVFRMAQTSPTGEQKT